MFLKEKFEEIEPDGGPFLDTRTFNAKQPMIMNCRLRGFDSRDKRLPEPAKAGRVVAMLVTSAVLCVYGCSAQDRKFKASDDVEALQQLVDIPVKLKSARWEIFGTPEYDGGVAGSTDYMTLVAEVEPVATAEGFTSGTNDRSVYIVPEAARPWLSSQFRSMLDKHRNTDIVLATAAGCHVYNSKIKKSQRNVSGFFCKKADKVLLYLSII